MCSWRKLSMVYQHLFCHCGSVRKKNSKHLHNSVLGKLEVSIAKEWSSSYLEQSVSPPHVCAGSGMLPVLNRRMAFVWVTLQWTCDGAIMYFAHGVKSFAGRFCALLMSVLLKLYYAENNQNKKICFLCPFSNWMLKKWSLRVSHTLCIMQHLLNWEKGENRTHSLRIWAFCWCSSGATLVKENLMPGRVKLLACPSGKGILL